MLRVSANLLGRNAKFTRLGTAKFSNDHKIGEIDGQIQIGDINKKLKRVINQELVPSKNYSSIDGQINLSQTILQHLRWILQKDILGQDIFLIGRPGSLKRSIAMTYLELTQREMEYVALNRDTTESDLKQRREILNGTAKYFDQCAVKAATEGRVLVIEGVEKAERNVLPVLNNLLENREMHLEDGRFLISAERYDKLLKDYNQAALDKWGLVRVSEDFRVIALGLPVPKYRGASLDPPLRSRFQARDITSLSFNEILQNMKQYSPTVPESNLNKMLSFGFAVLSTESSAALPDFPLDNIYHLGKIYENNKFASEFDLINRLYPHSTLLAKEQKVAVNSLFDSLKIKVPKYDKKQKIFNVEIDKNQAKVTLGVAKDEAISFIVSCGDKTRVAPQKFITTAYQDNMLSEMMQSHATGDFCLIGPKGSGKSTLVIEFCKKLKQTMEQMVLYNDMTSRDLIQQRTTKQSGDTNWKDSPLVQAARNGHVMVLDGIHRLHSSTIAILNRLIHDRELQLYDGKRLMRHDKYDEILTTGMTQEELNEKGIFKIHPSFRIIALAEPPIHDAANNWLTPEILSMFLFHEVRNLSKFEEVHIINELYGKISEPMQKIIDLAHMFRDASDPVMENLSGTLSTRQLLRIAQRMSTYSSTQKDDNINSAYETILRVFLAKFLPSLPRSVLEDSLKKCGIHSEDASSLFNFKKHAKVEVKGDLLKIGSTEVEIYKTKDVVKVPDILFFEIPQHVLLLEHLLQDFLLGSHLLLVGNQGVGKNKIVDRLLQLMNRPREYIQLHRDTTVQSLTVQPNIIDGVVVYEDSPLVKAVKNGHVLVIDEADKAPSKTLVILKTLVENGEMVLSDGRKILPTNAEKESSQDYIYTHKDFRIVVLANRPGFPFLGNDFFGSLGHLFSCHAVDNPDPESEVQLLRQYAPNVDVKIIRKLVNAFAELRTMADTGKINYPYSTREVVNIVKHLEKYPTEDICELVGNVLDFDRYAPETLDQVAGVLIKHGLKIEAYAKNELAAVRRQKEIQLTVQHYSGKGVSAPKHGKEDPKNEPHVGGNTWAGGSGGRDTAGLGGKGGPYRLDKGHKVHQLSDAEKDDIPEEVKAAARAMNRKAFDEKLKEIQMSKHDHNIYESFSQPVRQQVNNLKIILNSLEAKSKERHWAKHQTSGELDDMKLIEGITGERSIYKRRTEQDPEPGQVQEKPKRLTVVADVSGSMYRFNGYDGRLDRELEAIMMIMESFEGYENKIQYDIVGHSGESPCIPFIDHKNPPNNEKRRLDTIKMMHAHSQFCWSGDNTVSATRHAIDTIAKEECDEAIVVVLSDANLSRYGIKPELINESLIRQEPKVQGYVIFLGSLGEEANMIKSSMPAGRSFVCMNLEDLPQILKTIFQSSVLKHSMS